MQAGLTPAVNMDTGFVQILDDATRLEALDRTTALTGVTSSLARSSPMSEVPPLISMATSGRSTRSCREAARPVVFPVAWPQWPWRCRLARRVRARSRGTSIDSSGSSSARCSCPTAASSRSTPTGPSSTSPSASGPSTRPSSRGPSSGIGSPCADEVRPDFRVLTGQRPRASTW